MENSKNNKKKLEENLENEAENLDQGLENLDEETEEIDEQGPADPQDLAYNEEEDSFELDVNDEDPDWDHPMDYDTISEGAQDDDSTFDNSNPYVGEEYADREELQQEELEDNNMRITDDRAIRVSKEDEALSRNPEDYRDDLDEEGYPKNDEK